MSHHLDDDDDELNGHQTHRELTLSASTVLGIFFGLALSWALFFGFGYNMGAKSRQAAQASSDATDATSGSTANFNSFKPAPGSTSSQANNSQAPIVYPPAATSTGTIPPPMPAPSQPVASAPAPTPKPPDEETPSGVAAATPPKAARIVLPPTTNLPTTNLPPASASATGSFIVQIAAVSLQLDADMVTSAVRRKGYAPVQRTEPQDKLIHIQIGPFNNRKDADAMRQRLLVDGYNAIVK